MWIGLGRSDRFPTVLFLVVRVDGYVAHIIPPPVTTGFFLARRLCRERLGIRCGISKHLSCYPLRVLLASQASWEYKETASRSLLSCAQLTWNATPNERHLDSMMWPNPGPLASSEIAPVPTNTSGTCPIGVSAGVVKEGCLPLTVEQVSVDVLEPVSVESARPRASMYRTPI